MALGLAILGTPLVAWPPTRPQKRANSAAKPPQQRARLPRRLAADFHGHIETRLPHLRKPFESAARETGFSWRMLAALGYQESRWRPAAVSPRGAQGVMMLMPLTAKKMGVNNVFSPDENILGGARYLALHEGSHSQAHSRSGPHLAGHGGVQHRHRSSRGRAHHHADAQEESGSLGGRARQPAAAVRSALAFARETRLRQWPRNRGVRGTRFTVRGHSRKRACRISDVAQTLPAER